MSQLGHAPSGFLIFFSIFFFCSSSLFCIISAWLIQLAKQAKVDTWSKEGQLNDHIYSSAIPEMHAARKARRAGSRRAVVSFTAELPTKISNNAAGVFGLGCDRSTQGRAATKGRCCH